MGRRGGLAGERDLAEGIFAVEQEDGGFLCRVRARGGFGENVGELASLAASGNAMDGIESASICRTVHVLFSRGEDLISWSRE
jgi:hypothetical protein